MDSHLGFVRGLHVDSSLACTRFAFEVCLGWHLDSHSGLHVDLNVAAEEEGAPQRKMLRKADVAQGRCSSCAAL